MLESLRCSFATAPYGGGLVLQPTVGLRADSRLPLELDCAAAHKLDELVEDGIIAEECSRTIKPVCLFAVVPNGFLSLFAH